MLPQLRDIVVDDNVYVVRISLMYTRNWNVLSWGIVYAHALTRVLFLRLIPLLRNSDNKRQNNKV